MGRKGDGVEIREKSIRLSFVLDGREERKTLKVNGNQNSLEMARLESTLTSRKPPQDKERIS